MLQRRKLVVGNWKMHGKQSDNAALLAVLSDTPEWQGSAEPEVCELSVCVPFPYVAQARDALGGSGIAWGAQDVSEHSHGAYTGDVAASMLADFSCRHVIVGHSERRAGHAESNELVARKAVAVLAAGMTPIVCVGETLAQREAGQTRTVVGAQLTAVLDGVLHGFETPALEDRVRGLVVAYEPVWAIGTGRSASPAEAQEVHAYLRGHFAQRAPQAAEAVRIIYGGSVKPDNAVALFSMADVDGGLVGGAALIAADFLAIARAAGMH